MTTPSLPSWIAIADGGPVADLTAVVGMRTIHATADPAEFTEMLRSTRPRIAIIGTPPGGADEIAAALRERRRRPALRIVVLSPSEAITERLAALRAGADEAHPDTIDPGELGARLAILEERTRPRHDALLVVTDDVEMDLVAHEVRRGGALIHLRPKEFQLLAMPATHPGRAYSRRQIARSRLGSASRRGPADGRRPHPMAAEQARAPAEAPLHLVTVRGVGYRLDPSPR